MKFYVFQHLYMPIAYSLVHERDLNCYRKNHWPLYYYSRRPWGFGFQILCISTEVKEVCSTAHWAFNRGTMHGFMHIYLNCVGHIRMNPLTNSQWIMFWSGKIAYCVYKFVVPYFYTSFWHLVSRLHSVLNIIPYCKYMWHCIYCENEWCGQEYRIKPCHVRRVVAGASSSGKTIWSWDTRCCISDHPVFQNKN